MSQKIRHILSLSGGKDSTALAIYMRERVPELEYVFCDTDMELDETYEYLALLESRIAPKKIVRLRDDRGFEHWLKVYGGYLPSSRMRWCTKVLKIKPFEKYVGDDHVKMYIGIRADENRGGYVTSKPNIEPVYPFREDGIDLAGVHKILEDSGLGFPKYYEWRTRSGCYFCFYQRKHEWLGLKENHPDLFEKAKAYEKFNEETGERYTWSEKESLDEMVQPDRAEEIKRRQLAVLDMSKKVQPNRPLLEVLGQNDDDDDLPCSFCHT